MSAAKQLSAQARNRAGKGAARAVRREGRVPAVIYGGGQPAVSISLDFNQTKKLIFAGHFLTTVFEIDVDGEKTTALPRDYQMDPVKDVPVHIDFLRLAKGQNVKVSVPIHVTGQDVCPGVKNGGSIQIVEHAIELYAPPESIPDSIDVSVAEADIGVSIHIQDIKLPEGVRPVSRDNVTLVTISAPTTEEETTDTSAPAAAPAASA